MGCRTRSSWDVGGALNLAKKHMGHQNLIRLSPISVKFNFQRVGEQLIY